MEPDVRPGHAFPLGATVTPEGVNFAVFSKNAVALELLLFDDPDAAQPARVVPLNPAYHRTFAYWHVFVEGLTAGQHYGFRAHGPFDPGRGHRFDAEKVLLDPYARAVAFGRSYDRAAAARPGDNAAHAAKSVVLDAGAYDWEDDVSPARPLSRTVIYEMHVGGFTRHPSSGVAAERRGTYAGLVDKIPYLQELGVTAVELLPVQQFDAQSVHDPSLTNYWGYDPVAFFAPHAGYSVQQDPLGAVDEFRDMVKALHRAGLEVILDVVFNHTAEGNHEGPTFCFRGLENRAYYLLDQDPAHYLNYSGTGNTLNANHSVVRRMIQDCLRYWVTEMHVDGFRFDLASVLARDETGTPVVNPPVLWSIESDPVLAGTKLIAEAWDAAGLYQVGSFVGHRWAEWNGRFRDDVRRFVNGERGTVQGLASRIVGSTDLYHEARRDVNRSVNFVTCHDGFTLRDLVCYEQKHNEANGEDNRDGTDANYSWNCGVEGPTDDPEIEALRQRQMRNLLTVLLTAQGTPMLLMGDEGARTQQGNNNAYCQDNEISWMDWDALEGHADLLRFVRRLVAFTQSRPVFRDERSWAAESWGPEPVLRWHGVALGGPDWGDDSHSLAFEVCHPDGVDHLYVAFNAYREPLTFSLPPPAVGGAWYRIVDTALPPPADCCNFDDAPLVDAETYTVAAHASVVLAVHPER